MATVSSHDRFNAATALPGVPPRRALRAAAPEISWKSLPPALRRDVRETVEDLWRETRPVALPDRYGCYELGAQLLSRSLPVILNIECSDFSVRIHMGERVFTMTADRYEEFAALMAETHQLDPEDPLKKEKLDGVMADWMRFRRNLEQDSDARTANAFLGSLGSKLSRLSDKGQPLENGLPGAPNDMITNPAGTVTSLCYFVSSD